MLLKYILESRFRDRKNQIHLADVPMFSIFLGDGVSKKDAYNIKRSANRIKSAFEKARQQIHSIGFPSMHANVLIKDLSHETNQNTSRKDVGGFAHRKGKFMEIDSRVFSAINSDYLVKVIVHEWAHLWMFNNSKEFKESVNALYNKLVVAGAEKMKPQDVESHIMKKFNTTEELPLVRRWSNALYSVVWHLSTNEEFVKTSSREQLLQRIEFDVLKEFNEICYIHDLVPTQEITTNVKNMARNYIGPKIIQILKDENLRNELVTNDNVYDFLWTANDLKPADVSITKLFKQLYLEKEFPKARQDMLFTTSFSGKDYEFHRNYLKNLHNWVDAYGMSNNDELWATGIEEFFKLPASHRKAILKIMMRLGAK